VFTREAYSIVAPSAARRHSVTPEAATAAAEPKAILHEKRCQTLVEQVKAFEGRLQTICIDRVSGCTQPVRVRPARAATLLRGVGNDKPICSKNYKSSSEKLERQKRMGGENTK